MIYGHASCLGFALLIFGVEFKRPKISSLLEDSIMIWPLEFATEGLKLKDPCPCPRISRDFKVKDTHI